MSCLLRGGLPEEALASGANSFPGPAVSTVYGDFEIAQREDGSLWELGRGAMGQTYKAVDRVLHRTVALKVIRLGPGSTVDGRGSEGLRQRFLREARAAAALHHSNVAGVFQFGASELGGSCFYAMELVEGETLEARVRRNGPLEVETALELARQITAALVAAAGRGLIHRDLKPGNLMLAGGGRSPADLEVKVIDFGLAKAAAVIGETDLTHGGFVGTPAFASPEQFARDNVDARSDLYSLGVTIWYALTGRVPFGGRTFEELRDSPARSRLPVEQLTAKNVPPGVIALLRRLLAVDPQERPASARELLGALDVCRRQLAASDGASARRRRLAVAALVLAAAGGAWWWMRAPASAHRAAVAISTPPAVPAMPIIAEKSLAVLPFDIFSDDKDSAIFADGVQDEVLTDLAKVADLKVISRSSVLRYRDAKERNLREIGKALDVVYVVEGSVQRAGNKIRVVAQLIDARTDRQIWAEKYDRDLADVFAIQSEISHAIADQLCSNLTPAERSLIAAPPTTNLPAYELYTQARGIFVWGDPGGAEGSLRKKTALLEEAVRRDPSFALAYCELSKTYDDCTGLLDDRAYPELARQSAEKALQIQPGLGEAHRELARSQLETDPGRAYDEAVIAARTLPNDAEAHRVVGEADANKDLWEQALPEMEKANALDPGDGEIEYHLAELRLALRRYPEMEQALLSHRPVSRMDSSWVELLIAEGKLAMGDPAAAKNHLERVSPDFLPTEEFPWTRFDVARCLRDYDAAERAIAATPSQWTGDLYAGNPPQTWDNGMLARLRGDEGRARAIFTASLQWTPPATWDDERKERAHLSLLARCDAALGRKEDAIREARQMVAKYPLAKYPLFARTDLENLALVYTLTGERAQAISELEILSKMPASTSYGDLRCNPYWDPLRADPRFKAMVAAIAPKP